MKYVKNEHFFNPQNQGTFMLRCCALGIFLWILFTAAEFFLKIPYKLEYNSSQIIQKMAAMWYIKSGCVPQ